MPNEPLAPVTPGTAFQPSATAHNYMLAAARDFRAQQSPTLEGLDQRQTGIVSIKNTTGGAIARHGVLGISGVIIDPATDLEGFRERPRLTGTTPATADHLGRFAVALEGIGAGEIGRAAVAGLVICQINAASGEETITHADIDDGDSTRLTVNAAGSARIIHRESGTGAQWGLVSLGNPAGGSSSEIFAIGMQRTGGTGGGATSQASYTYTITRAIGGESLGTSINPSSSPHKWRRPSRGQLNQATYGIAHYDANGHLSILWCNEVEQTEVCPE